MNLRSIIIAVALFTAAGANAQTATVIEQSTTVIQEVSDTHPVTTTAAVPLRFSWGADLTGGIDISGHDMSTLGVSAMFGLEWRWVRFAGVSAQANTMVGNSGQSYPLAVVFQTDFSNHRRLLFMDLRGGLVLDNFDKTKQQTAGYASCGVGVTLAHGKTFSSHLILSYAYNGASECMLRDVAHHCSGLSYATLRLGIRF